VSHDAALLLLLLLLLLPQKNEKLFKIQNFGTDTHTRRQYYKNAAATK
jgi:hypothetical protein